MTGSWRNSRPHSVIINATGMGKDTPGSPITWDGKFPMDSIAWEFNYRGELDFLHQALAQVESRKVIVEDGWLYFVHGWTQVVAQVLHFDLTPELFDKLNQAASSVRGSRTQLSQIIPKGASMNKNETAANYHERGYGCAQSVLASFAE